MALEQVCADLEAEGYAVQSFIIPACARNATHRRDRVWIVANANSARSTQCVTTTGTHDLEAQRARQHMSDVEETRSSREVKPGIYRTHDGFSTGVDRSMTDPFSVSPSVPDPGKGYTSRVKALGNAIVPHVVYEIFKAIEAIGVANNADT